MVHSSLYQSKQINFFADWASCNEMYSNVFEIREDGKMFVPLLL